MITISIEKDWETEYIIFTVPIPNRSPVFMSMKVSEYTRDKRGIVIVDSEKFLQLWRNEPYSIHREQAFGNAQTWPKDRKFQKAEKGFSFGCDNPVPLAYVSHGKERRTIVSYKFLWFGKSECEEHYHYVSFTNGVTRTMWLLTHGCSAFPVECEMPGARELYRVAGAPGTQFHTIGELAKSIRADLPPPAA